MQCPQCQHENPAGQKFCGECGARLTLVCPACGTANPSTSRFCGECGVMLAARPPAPAAGPVQTPTAGPEAPAPTAVAATRPAGSAPTVAPPGGHVASPGGYTPKHVAASILTSGAAVEGEHKQVTVMFTDVSGFTAMSERLDPEEVHAIMDRAFEVILAAVHRYEGTINQFLGDGVMALFGAPIAHEDHAGRSLRAALAIQRDLGPLQADVQRAHGRDFRTRIGINTGPVVVGAIGRDLRRDYTALGDTVNLASRLLNIAQPGQIVASRHTKELCEGFFAFEDLGTFQVKGKTDPVRAYAVGSEIGGRTRLEVRSERGLTPLIGRGAEQQRLAQAFRQARDGRGGVVVITGDPGVGKSRLLYEFLRGLDGSDHLELVTTCASYGRAMPYRPLVELYRRYFDLPEDLSPIEGKQRVADRLAALGLDGEEPAYLVDHFLGLAVPPEFLLRVQGARLRDRTNECLGRVILHESARWPVVLAVENMQWADDSSQEFLRSLAERVREHAVLLLLTARPGLSLEWLPPVMETVELGGLDGDDLGEMMRALCGSHRVSEPLFQLLLAKGAGNPLYVEEIVRQLQETDGIVIEDGEARLRTADVTVPATIRDIIAARVDRLAASPKQTLQVASVVGRRFGVALVSRVRERERDQVAADLKDLHAGDFIFPGAYDLEPTYDFKHALTQDVVYTSLLERRRRRFHAAAGRGLEDLYASRLDDVVELLAHHFERGGEDAKAVDYAILAAEKAQRRWANAEALALFEAALKRLAAMPDTDANRLRKIDAVVKQAEVKFALGRHAEQVQALEEIHALADAVEEPSRRAAWYCWAGFLHSLTGGRVDTPIAYCRQAQAIADGAGLDELRAFAECSLAHVLLVAGDLHGAMTAGARALATFEARGNVWWACRTLWALSPVANALGDWTRGLEYCRRALDHGQAVDDLRLKVVGWWRTGSTYIQQGDVEAGLRCCEEALALAPVAFDAAMVRAVRGYGLVKAGQLDRGTPELAAAVGWFERSNLKYTRALFALWLAEAYVHGGNRREATTTLEDILATSVENGYRHLEGVAERLLAQVLGPAHPDARAHLERGMGMLEAMGARNEVAKALVTHAELLRAGGDAAGARRQLERARDIFHELGTLDGIASARAILAALS